MTGPRVVPAATPVLVVDVGGTTIKLRASDWPQTVRLRSGPAMGPREMVAAVRAHLGERRYGLVTLGYPGPVRDGRPARDPHNLAPGWVGFDFEAALGARVRTINDASLQALGNWQGRRLLFLGFGTGLGSAIVVDERTVLPLELAHLPYRDGRTFEEFVGAAGRARLGDAEWRAHCLRVLQILGDAMQAEEIVIGGGNARRLPPIPAGTRLGEPDAAFAGGRSLWSTIASPSADT